MKAFRGMAVWNPVAVLAAQIAAFDWLFARPVQPLNGCVIGEGGWHGTRAG